MSGFFLGGSAVCAVVYWVFFCYRAASFWKSIFKTAAVVLLVAVSLVSDGPVLVSLALATCAVGDYLLSRDSETSFLAGVAAFALGHVFYIFAILGHEASVPERAMQGWLGWSLVILAFGMALILYRRAGEMRFAVLAYIPMVAALGLAGLTMPMEDPVWLVVIGGVMFVFSDFVLAVELFLLGQSQRLRVGTSLTVWASYWLAQSFLLAGLAL